MRPKKGYIYLVLFAAALAVFGLIVGDPSSVPEGLLLMWKSPAGLLLDYIEFAGISAAFVNASLVTFISILVLWHARCPVNGSTIGTVGIMAGFALFGKNVFNSLPIIIGGYLHVVIRKTEPQASCRASLMASCLGPIVSFIAVGTSMGSTVFSHILAFIVGIVIGIAMPYLSGHTAIFQHGMNLYNTGFTCGFIAILFNAFVSAFGDASVITRIWGNAYNSFLCVSCIVFNIVFILIGIFFCGKKPSEAISAYRGILREPYNDYIEKNGAAGTCINIGVDGLLVCIGLILIGGDFNGPTLAGIFSVMGFSAKGKTVKLITPLFAGVVLAAVLMPAINLTDYSVQLGVLFISACAPLVYEFGWLAGILCGFIHCVLVQKTGGFAGGFNLYNNGFSAGLVSAMLFPMLNPLKQRIQTRNNNSQTEG